MLQTFEVEITKCKSGAEALSVLEMDEFDLIILDQRMPEMDGIELLHLIRKLDNANAMVPILCATADFGPEVSRMLLNEGFQDYLAKPVRRFYLERMLRQYMPQELAVNIMIDAPSMPPEEHPAKENVPAEDPKHIDFETGLNNLGGNEEAFASVINAYYKEGLLKTGLVPKLLMEQNMEDYIIEVHALKSSSAAIGAKAMSVLFRELEFAGKASNLEFVEGHTDSVMAIFAEVLDVVKAYLIENGILETAIDPEAEKGEEMPFDDSVIDELIASLSNFNIKETEERVNECVGINYGKELNRAFCDIKNCLDVFDYHKAKELLIELKRRRGEK